MRISKKQEVRGIVIDHSSDIDPKSFIELYSKNTAESFLFLVTDPTLLSDNSLRFWKKLLKEM